MAPSFWIQLQVLLLLAGPGLGAPPRAGGRRREAEVFLEKYGYLGEHTLQASSSTKLTDAIREFQWVSHLPVSGQLDTATMHQMAQPRCGVDDKESHSAWTERLSSLFAGRRAKMRLKKRFVQQRGKWYKRHLSYRLVNWPEYLPEPAVRRAVQAAFQVWSNVSSLEFWEAPASSPADIRLTFFQGDHNDGLSNAFDGPGQPLGGSVAEQLPGKLFTNFEDWDSHRPWDTKPGARGPYYCHSFFDTITADKDHRVYIFKGNSFWEVEADGNVSEPQLLQEKWASLPPYIEAAAVSQDDGDFYFFKGSRCWRFQGSKLLKGYPQQCRAGGLPRHPDAAFFFPPLHRLVLFKGSRYYVLADGGLQIEPYYPRGLRDWGGVPSGVQGALPGPEGSILFFQDDRYWRFDPISLKVVATGQWAKELPWMGCWDANSGSALF
ncbi:matrix metalloproteinase-28 isoform X4 [Monodelphis domestica]|uniref:matrix metalloproteinase-28 isoform X4 n=1 Tax=Monodelphis domestica TaxID=13616 RepID=UPI0024E23489|nr:matrix metalloproteinase-28 isoform X4 [Monodelphis domestica]